MSDFQVVKYKTPKGTHVEILVKPQTVLKYREGDLSIKETIFSDVLYSSHTKGEKVKIEDIKYKNIND